MDEQGPTTAYQLYRNILQVLARGTGPIILGTLFVISMILHATHMAPEPTASARDFNYVASAVFAGVGLSLIWLGIRTIGSGIAIGPDGVVVRRVIRGRRYVPWAEVAGFQLIRARRFDNQFSRQATAIAVLRNHHPPLYCIGASFMQPSPAAEQMLHDLESRRQSWLHGTGSADTG